MILLSWKAKWLEINFLISEAWAERDLLHSTSPSQHFFILSIGLPTSTRCRLHLLLPRQRNQKINLAQRTFYDSRLLLYADGNLNSRNNIYPRNIYFRLKFWAFKHKCVRRLIWYFSMVILTLFLYLNYPTSLANELNVEGTYYFITLSNFEPVISLCFILVVGQTILQH